MMTIDDITENLKMLSANYGESFFRGTSLEDMIKTWTTQFANDDPELVKKGVQNCINTLSYRPTIHDIRVRMAKSKIKGQMTPTEAFQSIYLAVNESYDRESATVEYNKLTPILRKVVGFPTQLVSWHHVSDEAFQTVIMSAIRESYRELAQRELDYYALPEQLQFDEGWMIEAPTQEALPEPKIEKTIKEIEAENEAYTVSFREINGLKPDAEKNAERIADFLKPLTDEDLKRIEENNKRRAERYLK